MYGVACKVRSDFVSVPAHLGIDDSKCCIQFMHNNDKWTMCSTT